MDICGRSIKEQESNSKKYSLEHDKLISDCKEGWKANAWHASIYIQVCPIDIIWLENHKCDFNNFRKYIFTL